MLSITLAGLLYSTSLLAQYPDIPADVQRKSDSLMRAANRHSDSAWQVAWPIIQEEAK